MMHLWDTLYVRAEASCARTCTAPCAAGVPPASRGRGPSTAARDRIPEMVNISERPPEVADRAVPGHWEGDLIVGSRQSHIRNLVERSTRFVMLLKLTDATAEEVCRAMTKRIKTLPMELARSVTSNQATRWRCTASSAWRPGSRSTIPRAPVAARVEREHQWTLASVLPEGNGLVPSLAGQVRPRCP